jgi:chemotaxis protein CheD
MSEGFAQNRFWDGPQKTWVVQVLPGELYVTDESLVIATVLGSCVSACMRDAAAGVGGMNHFLLPVDPDKSSTSPSVRYGVYALERLLNELYARGARRERIETKIFGGAAVLSGMTDVGSSNVAFVRRFLSTERLAVAAEDLGLSFARRIRYQPVTGRAQVKRLPMQSARSVLEREAEHERNLRARPPGGTVELF